MEISSKDPIVSGAKIPPEFDVEIYRRNPDLQSFTADQLAQHYEIYGIAEGRLASEAALREIFVEYVRRERSILEIGPFCNPCVQGAHVKYFDVLTSDELRIRAEEIGYAINVVPNIAFVSSTGDLSVVDEHFAAVVSSHSIEHQPDLVEHLVEVSRILEPGGRYFLLVPDKRYCIDHFIPCSTIADVIEAHTERRRTHRIGNVIEHRALTTHNDAMRHWQGDHADSSYRDTIAPRAQYAMREFEAANGAYIDVHAWKFTPDTFRQMINSLNELGLIDLRPERVYQTPFARNEFTAILYKA